MSRPHPPGGADRAPAAGPHAAAPPRPLPLFLPIGADTYRPREVPREPGDEARRLVELWPEGVGGPVTAADCGDRHECSCAEWRRTGRDCAHTRTLEAARIFGVARKGVAR